MLKSSNKSMRNALLLEIIICWYNVKIIRFFM